MPEQTYNADDQHAQIHDLGKGALHDSIRLFCNAGMSTSLLVESMRKTAAEEGLDVVIESFPAGQMDQSVAGADVALLGPQVSFMLATKQKLCDSLGIPLAVIPVRDYGMVNGKAVLDFALSLLER